MLEDITVQGSTEQRDSLWTLHAFQQALAGARDRAGLETLVADYLGAALGATAVSLVATGAPASNEGDRAYHLARPLAGLEQQLVVFRATPFDTPEEALTDICAALIAPVAARVVSAADESAAGGADPRQTNVALNKAITAVSTSLDLTDVLDKLLRALAEVVPYEAATIALVADGQPTLSAFRRRQEDQTTLQKTLPLLSSSALMQRIITEQRSVLLRDTREEPAWISREEHPIRAWIGAPLILGDTVLGVLMVDGSAPGAFQEEERRLVETLASQAAVAVQNAQLHAEVQRQLMELGVMYEASATMTADLDQTSVLATVAEEMVRVMAADLCTIFVWDPHQRLLKAAASATAPDVDVNAPAGLETLYGLDNYPSIRPIFETQEMRALRTTDSESDADTALLRQIDLQGALFVPLIWHQKVQGLLAIGQVDEPRYFTRRDMRLARNLAGKAAVAIEHARLYSQAQRRIDELSTFQRISLQINSLHDLNTVLSMITDSALQLIDANNLHIYLYDPEREQFTVGAALWRDGRRTPAVSKLRSNGLTATVVRKAEPIIINDAPRHPLFQKDTKAYWGIQAIAAFPLKRGQRVIGAFTATFLTPHTFTDDEILLLSLLADQAAVAIENANLFAEAQRRLAAMSALVDMAQQVMGHLVLGPVMEATVESLRGLLKARASSIAVLHDDELVIEAASGIKERFHLVRMKVGEGVSGKAVKERRPVYVADTLNDPNFLFFDTSVRSLISVPLMSRDEVLGALAVDSDKPDAFDESDIQLMTVAAAQVSIAVANARLFEQAEIRNKKLAAAYEELQESDRLKDELVQNVSHELRTPLTFVKGYVDLLLAGDMGNVNDNQRNALQIVADKTTEITRLVADIMTLQRVNESNLILEPFSMAEFVEMVIENHRLRLDPEKLALVYERPSVPAHVLADKGRMTQVLDNLIDNAVKFSPDGGTITVAVSRQGDDILITVRDEGIGISADKLPRIFDRFYQVDGSSSRRFGGAGIGLAIVQRMVEAHRGHIWVESEMNVGSTFYITLPRVDEAEL